MIKAIIFDVDGTLLDTEKVYMQAWRQAGAAFGYTVTEEALLRTRAVRTAVAVKVFQETVAVFVVAHGLQFCHERFVAAHPAVKGLEGSGCLAVRTVKLGQFGLGVRL